MRPLVVIPEAMPISKALTLMQQRHVQMVLVADEYGGTAGLITMEDLVEEMVMEMVLVLLAEMESQVKVTVEIVLLIILIMVIVKKLKIINYKKLKYYFCILFV